MKIDLLKDTLDVGFSKRAGVGRRSNVDVNVIIRASTKDRKGGIVSFSISNEASRMLGKKGDTFMTKIYEKNGIFRIYFIQNVNGYALTAFNGENGRLHLRIPPIDQRGNDVMFIFKKYEGDHELEYDEENEKFFISAKKGVSVL